MHNDKQKPCRLFVVPGGEPALGVETLELISTSYIIIVKS